MPIMPSGLCHTCKYFSKTEYSHKNVRDLFLAYLVQYQLMDGPQLAFTPDLLMSL